MKFQLLSEREENAATIIVNAAYQVHKQLGPGLLEKVYEACMAHVILKSGLAVSRQVEIAISFDGIELDEKLRLDMLVDTVAICEIKAVDLVNPVWPAQVLSHLKLTKIRLGFLINFNVPLIKNGIKRFVL